MILGKMRCRDSGRDCNSSYGRVSDVRGGNFYVLTARDGEKAILGARERGAEIPAPKVIPVRLALQALEIVGLRRCVRPGPIAPDNMKLSVSVSRPRSNAPPNPLLYPNSSPKSIPLQRILTWLQPPGGACLLRKTVPRPWAVCCVSATGSR